MTDEIYLNIESDPNLVENDVINVRVNLPKESTTGNNISTPKIKSTTTTAATSSTSKRVRDNRNEKAQNRAEESSVISNNENRENRNDQRCKQRQNDLKCVMFGTSGIARCVRV